MLISIHALLAESDAMWFITGCPMQKFLSTLSLRRATSGCGTIMSKYPHFYPRSPCGERLSLFSVEADFTRISIHALLAESDNIVWHVLNRARYFYPRSPCGERQPVLYSSRSHLQFLSTLSLRRATAKVHKTVGYFCAYETNFMEIASSC